MPGACLRGKERRQRAPAGRAFGQKAQHLIAQRQRGETAHPPQCLKARAVSYALPFSIGASFENRLFGRMAFCTIPGGLGSMPRKDAQVFCARDARIANCGSKGAAAHRQRTTAANSLALAVDGNGIG